LRLAYTKKKETPVRDRVWNDIAKVRGFESMEEMLNILYVERQMNKGQIAYSVGCCPPTVSALLYNHRIPERGKVITVKIPEKELKDTPLAELSHKYHISKSRIWNERLRKGMTERRRKVETKKPKEPKLKRK